MKRSGLYAKRLSVVLCAVILAALVFAPAAAAQWPDGKAVTLVVPFAAGGGTDIIARMLVEAMQPYVNGPIVIKNVPGSGSAIGTNEVMLARPDGYTLLLSGTHTITAALQGYTIRSLDSLEHVASLNWDPYVIAVGVNQPYHTLEELIEAGSAVTFGNAGAGALTHLVSEALNEATGAGWRIVPFNGGAQLIANVVGGHVVAGIFSQSEMLGQLTTLRPLAVTSSTRSPLFPDIPTLEELGYTGIPQGSFRSISAPKGLAPEVKQAIAKAVYSGLTDPKFRQYAAENGLIETYLEGPELEAYYAELEELLRGLLEKIGAL
ncbi:MAG: tripartite tricarboxylate transporter substrate binding protein [Firmicutes bacterium]|nr:tripartite tricarboxylate transporter substrate binding protein [Bacillota bacterium]